MRVQKSQSMGSFRQVVPQNGVHNDNTPHGHTTNADEMVQDVVYALGGYESKFFKKDVPGGGLKVNTKTGVNAKDYAMLSRLCETAFYLERIIAFTDSSTGQSPLGLLGQGLVTALKQELTQYYGFVAMLQERVRFFLLFIVAIISFCYRHLNDSYFVVQINRSRRTDDATGRLTMLQIEMLMVNPSIRLQFLVDIAESCQEKKGGALASKIYAFRFHGNTKKKAIVHKLLVAVCTPLQYMLGKWLIEGEINDPHAEFFIEVLPEVGTDRLWNDKYRVRESMLPCFISA